jgi:hypothetical protein
MCFIFDNFSFSHINLNELVIYKIKIYLNTYEHINLFPSYVRRSKCMDKVLVRKIYII